MTTDALLFARVVARVAYYIIRIRRSVRLLHATARMRRMPTTCHHASFIDTLPSFDQSAGTPVSWELRLAIIQWQQVATGGIQSHPVAPVTSSGNKWHPVTIQMSSGNRCLLVAVRSHFGLRLGGLNKGWWASTGLGKPPPEPPPSITYSI